MFMLIQCEGSKLSIVASVCILCKLTKLLTEYKVQHRDLTGSLKTQKVKSSNDLMLQDLLCVAVNTVGATRGRHNKFISVPSFLISVGTVLFVFGNMSNLK